MTTVAPPSDSRDLLDWVEKVERVEVEGVDTERSSSGTASRASEGEMLNEGEVANWIGEVMLDLLSCSLSVGSILRSRILESCLHMTALSTTVPSRSPSQLK